MRKWMKDKEGEVKNKDKKQNKLNEVGKKEKVDSLVAELELNYCGFNKKQEFVENLFVGRFNFFLVVYSLFLTAGFASRLDGYRCLVFVLGLIILSSCWVPLFRSFIKHDRYMRLMFNIKILPAAIVEEIMRIEEYKKAKSFKVSYWMGIYIPGLCVLSLLIIVILLIPEFITSISNHP
jgi:hypothetical protein